MQLWVEDNVTTQYHWRSYWKTHVPISRNTPRQNSTLLPKSPYVIHWNWSLLKVPNSGLVSYCLVALALSEWSVSNGRYWYFVEKACAMSLLLGAIFDGTLMDRNLDVIIMFLYPWWKENLIELILWNQVKSKCRVDWFNPWILLWVLLSYL